jgi:hypothetical protein
MSAASDRQTNKTYLEKGRQNRVPTMLVDEK